jgi:Peptidase A4 family
LVRNGVAGALIFVVAALVGAPVAVANTTRSTNWAGYAIHRTGVSFRQVSATWTEPDATCVPGQPSYSAVWVGLGGYKLTSDALEQTGTEVDCSGAGKVVSSAWFELVPAPSRNISLRVNPGDVVHASVTVTGHQVVVELNDETSHRQFQKTLNAPSIDVSSAEWIVEAPSECLGQNACQALPLADFGSVAFGSVSATTVNGTVGSIRSRIWGRTTIDLIASTQRMLVARSATGVLGTAAPSRLTGHGRSFDVTYAQATAQDSPSFARRLARLSAGYIEH